MQNLHDWADAASVATFILALAGASIGFASFVWVLWDRLQKRLKLERYLKAEKEKKKDNGRRSILRIISDLGLTEDEIVQLSFRSKRIIRRRHADDDSSLTSAILFEYKD
jgi:hypothetical protein